MKGSRSRGSSAPELEEITLRAFLHPDRVERYLLLLKNPRTRRRALDEVVQKAPFDAAAIRPLPRPTAWSAEDLCRALRDFGIGATCYVMSEAESVDGRVCALEEALEAGLAAQGTFGTLISGAPLLVGCFLGESHEERRLLIRTERKTPRA